MQQKRLTLYLALVVSLQLFHQTSYLQITTRYYCIVFPPTPLHSYLPKEFKVELRQIVRCSSADLRFFK